MIGERARRSLTHRKTASFALRPRLEELEDRLLPYATTGMQWPQPKLITYSIVPDGTSIGGVPSNLQRTLNARFATADWQAQFAKAAAAWEKVANINFTRVGDSGAPFGVSGNLQSDPRFGDIRIGGYPMTGSILAFAFLPPPANGGTSAGDILFNTNISWQINATTYDLMTVALHEFGHALGMNHSAISTAVMWPSYTGAKEVLTSDDTAGIRTIYNSRQNDLFDANGTNDLSSEADNISSYIASNGQLTLPALDSTTPITIGSNDPDWYKITVPATTTGTMVVRMQSTNLSLLSPWLAVYNSAGTTLLGQASSMALGDTVTVTINNVSAGQVYDIRCEGATTGDSGFGAYGLQVNFGSQTQAPVMAPNTTMAAQADQGGGTLAESSAGPVDGDRINLGNYSGLGDAMMINFADGASLDNDTFAGVLPWTPLLPVYRAIAVSQNSPGLASNIQGLMAPLDSVFTLNTSDTLTAAIDNVTPSRADDTRLGLEVSRSDGSRFAADRTSPDRSLPNSTRDDQVVAVVPSLISAKDRYAESMTFGAIDVVLDGWTPELLD